MGANDDDVALRLPDGWGELPAALQADVTPPLLTSSPSLPASPTLGMVESGPEVLCRADDVAGESADPASDLAWPPGLNRAPRWGEANILFLLS